MSTQSTAPISDYKNKLLKEGCLNYVILHAGRFSSFCKTKKEALKEIRAAKNYNHPTLFCIKGKSDEYIVLDLSDSQVRMTANSPEFLSKYPPQINERVYYKVKLAK